MFNPKALGKQVRNEIHSYDKLAKQKGYTCLNISWLQSQMRINTPTWIEIKAGSPKIAYETFQHSLGLIKQAKYNLAQKPKKQVSNQNVYIVHGHNSAFHKSNLSIASHDTNNVKGNQAFKKFIKQHHISTHSTNRIITAIKPQKKHRNRFNIFLNNRYAFPVSASAIAKFYLYKGKNISHKLQDEIVKADIINKLFSYISNYVSRSMHTEYEVKKKLRKYSKNQKAINTVIKKLRNLNLINDKKYATFFVRDKINLSNNGPQQIKEKLFHKKIDPQYVDEALKQYSSDDQLKKVIKLAKQKFSNYKNRYSYNKAISKTREALYRKGFASDVISKVFSDEYFVKDNDKEYQLLNRKYDQAKMKYSRYKKNKFKYYVKIKQYLVRQQFTFDEIENVLND